jgi:sulfate adenylyltransferase
MFFPHSLVVFFTGLPGSGKTTLAKALADSVESSGRTVTLLDGDEIRTWLSNGLGYSRQDRDTNVLRIGRVAAEIARHGGVTICAAIAPYREARAAVRSMVEATGALYIEVYLSTPVEICERRDPKGHYRKARDGGVPLFTGVNDPYEPPLSPTLALDTSKHDVAAALDAVFAAISRSGG